MAHETEGVLTKGKPDLLSTYLTSPDKSAFYANGMEAGLTATESFIIFKQNNAQKVAVTMPLPLLKSLYLSIGKMIEDYEKRFGQKIVSIEELREIENKLKGQK